MRAIEAVKEQIAAYVRNFSGVKGKLSEDDIAAIAEKFEEVGTAQYKKLFYNAVDENGKEYKKLKRKETAKAVGSTVLAGAIVAAKIAACVGLVSLGVKVIRGR